MASESEYFGVDPCPNVPKYLEVSFYCVDETSTTTSTTQNPLPPWLTTSSSISFLPGLLDLGILSQNDGQIPFLTSKEETTVSETYDTTESVTEYTVEYGSSPLSQDIEEDLLTTESSKRKINHRNIPVNETKYSSERDVGKVSTESAVINKSETFESQHSEENYRNRLVYTSYRSRSESDVKIVLSTLPPSVHVPPSLSPHNELASREIMCPPRDIRALSWSWTRQDSESVQLCPQGTVGEARWYCSGNNNFQLNLPNWETPSPDLSECQSVWMEKIIKDLRKSELIINLANDLMQYVSVNALYGGDIKSTIDAITIIAEKMQYQLSNIPTRKQREAMVMELVQSVTKTASSLLSYHNIPAWQDLPSIQRKRFLSNFVKALEKTGSLLPGAVANDQEISISSDNLLLTARKISFRNMRNTAFPSLASLATPYWKHYSDNIEIPAVVLMENMNMEGSEVVFLSLRNLEKLLDPNQFNKTFINSDNEMEREKHQQIVNSQVIHLSFGEKMAMAVVNEPLKMTFQHKSIENVTSPQCVMWERDSWSPDYCELIFTNQTHSICECSRVGTFALLEKMEHVDKVSKMTFLVMVIVAVSVSIIAFISVLLMFLYCHRLRVEKHLRLGLTKTDISAFKNKQKCWSLNDTSTSVNENLFPTNQRNENRTTFDLLKNSDFMILSRAALEAHDTVGGEHTVQTGCIPGPQVHTVGRQGGRTMAGINSGMTNLHFSSLSTCRLQSPTDMGLQHQQPQAGNHIYMEVDPLYAGGGYSGVQVNCVGQETGLVSSSSSQTSSGYSTAPSQSQSFYETPELGDPQFDYGRQHHCPGHAVFQHPQFTSQNPRKECDTKDRVLSVYSISQSCVRPDQQSNDRAQQFQNIGAMEFGTAHPLLIPSRKGGERI